MSNRLGGKQGTAYLGTNASNPPNITYLDRNPGMYDIQGYSLGDLILNTTNEALWYLASLQGNPTSRGLLAQWLEVDQTEVGSTMFVTDNGTAIPLASILNVNGGPNINTTGSSNSIQVNLNTTLTDLTSVSATNVTVTNDTVTNNLTINDTITLSGTSTLELGNIIVTTSETFGNLGRGVVQSSSSGVLSSSEGTNGQLLISSSTGAPAWANIIAGSNISIVNAANSVTISATSSNGWTQIGTTSGTGIINIPSGYDTFYLTGYFVITPGGSTSNYYQVYLQLSSNNGSSYYSSYLSGLNFLNSSGPSTNINFNTTSGLEVGVTYNVGTGASTVLAFGSYIYNVNSGTAPISQTCISNIYIGGIRTYQGLGSGVCNDTITGPINALKVVIVNVAAVLNYNLTLYGLAG